MRNRLFVVVGLGAVLALGGCSISDGGTISDNPPSQAQDTKATPDAPAAQDEPAAEAGDQPAADAEQPAENPAFGQTYTYENGLSVSVAPPTEFTPNEWSVGHAEGQKALAFAVTIANGSKENFDPTLFMDSVSSGGAESEAIFDSENNIGTSPSTAVLPGKSVTFTVGYSIADPADIVMEIAPNWDYEKVIFTNS